MDYIKHYIFNKITISIVDKLKQINAQEVLYIKFTIEIFATHINIYIIYI